MRLIDADRLKATLGCLGQAFPCLGDDGCCRVLFRKVKEAVDDQPTVVDWVGVDEALPAVGKEVLVCAIGKAAGHEGEIVYTLCKRRKLRTVNGDVEKWDSPWQYFHSDFEITHWMKLPPIPEELSKRKATVPKREGKTDATD